MLYPASGETEYNFYYPTGERFSYVTDTKSTEEPLIETQSDSAVGSLYMYRDSFGNALVPFFASAFAEARFTKSFPMILENDVTSGSADIVIFEMAERNIDWFLTMPPVVTAPELIVYEAEQGSPCSTRLAAKMCEYSPAYIEISGKLEYDSREGSPVYLRIKGADGTERTFRCFNTLSGDGEDGFKAYIKSEEFAPGEALDISVLIEKNGDFYQIDQMRREITK